MTYDPIDTNEADSTADGNIEAEQMDVVNNLTSDTMNVNSLLEADEVEVGPLDYVEIFTNRSFDGSTDTQGITFEEYLNNDTLSIVGYDSDGSIRFYRNGNRMMKIDSGALDMGANGITNVRTNGHNPVVSGVDYEVQKDGTDGAGIINFKTS
jgi:hypothetical protein